MKELATHFEFGRNWSGFADLIDESRITQAVQGLERLAGGCPVLFNRVHRDGESVRNSYAHPIQYGGY